MGPPGPLYGRGISSNGPPRGWYIRRISPPMVGGGGNIALCAWRAAKVAAKLCAAAQVAVSRISSILLGSTTTPLRGKRHRPDKSDRAVVNRPRCSLVWGGPADCAIAMDAPAILHNYTGNPIDWAAYESRSGVGLARPSHIYRPGGIYYSV